LRSFGKKNINRNLLCFSDIVRPFVLALQTTQEKSRETIRIIDVGFRVVGALFESRKLELEVGG
jgi:hypothetical protein